MTAPRSFWIPLIALWIALFAWGTEAWAETVYVQAKTAQLRAGKTSLDAVVGNVKFGDALEVVTLHELGKHLDAMRIGRSGASNPRPATP